MARIAKNNGTVTITGSNGRIADNIGTDTITGPRATCPTAETLTPAKPRPLVGNINFPDRGVFAASFADREIFDNAFTAWYEGNLAEGDTATWTDTCCGGETKTVTLDDVLNGGWRSSRLDYATHIEATHDDISLVLEGGERLTLTRQPATRCEACGEGIAVSEFDATRACSDCLPQLRQNVPNHTQYCGNCETSVYVTEDHRGEWFCATCGQEDNLWFDEREYEAEMGSDPIGDGERAWELATDR